MKQSRTLWKTAAAAALVAGVALLLLPHIERRFFYRNPGQSAREQLNPWRRKLMAPHCVVGALRLPSGAAVLDFGAGYGLFTYELARAAGRDGKVFATDCDRAVADYLARQNARLGVSNVFPVVVESRGVDLFYRTNVFDVIFACDVLSYLGPPASQQAFLSVLGRSLKKEGSVWVLMNRFDADFTPGEFEDWGVVLDALSDPGAQALLLKRFRPQTREALASDRVSSPADSARRLLVEDLNRVLEDPSLWPEAERLCLSPALSLCERYRLPRESLVKKLRQTEGFAWTAASVPENARPLLRMLNRLVVQDLLATYVFEKAFHLDQYSADNWKYMTEGLSKLSETVPMIEKAGYRLICEHPLLATHWVWEFRLAESLAAR